MEKAKYDWPFEFKPYDIQHAFMTELYNTIEAKKSGIFESPTGTGKSLSIICSVLKWLQDNRVISEDKGELENIKNPWLKRKLQKLRQISSPSMHESRFNDLEKKPTSDAKKESVLERYRRNKTRGIDEIVNVFGSNFEAVHERRQKVFICSRTHSQLTQLAVEINKTPFARNLSVICLASRKFLCNNKKLKDKNPGIALAAACKDICEKNKCDYNNGNEIEAFSNEILKSKIVLSISDLEDLALEKQACSYFATRRSLANADVVLLPYNFLIDPNTRESLGIDITDQVVIFDEAHNILDAVRNSRTTRLKIASFRNIAKALLIYQESAISKTSGETKEVLSHLLLVLNKICLFLCGKDMKSQMDIDSFVIGCKLQTMDISSLTKQCRSLHLAHRLHTFYKKNQEQEYSIVEYFSVMSFLDCLEHENEEGMIFFQNEEVIFYMFNVTRILGNLLIKSRSIIFTGGTMKPHSDIIDLYSTTFKTTLDLISNKLKIFSCSHVVPKENVLCLIFTTGPTNKLLNLTYENRTQVETMNEIGQALRNFCNVVPNGVVAFFSSYDYLDRICKHWSSSHFDVSSKKQLFIEKRNVNTANLLSEYTRVCKSKGGLLLTVVNGKLSEGINFSNELCRAVVMVGIPFPNTNDPVTKFKNNRSKYADFLEIQSMKSVNQCIGRAIRNKDDFASIILLDRRYTGKSVQQKIPEWVMRNMIICKKFGKGYRSLAQFQKRK